MLWQFCAADQSEGQHLGGGRLTPGITIWQDFSPVEGPVLSAVVRLPGETKLLCVASALVGLLALAKPASVPPCGTPYNFFCLFHGDRLVLHLLGEYSSAWCGYTSPMYSSIVVW